MAAGGKGWGFGPIPPPGRPIEWAVTSGASIYDCAPIARQMADYARVPLILTVAGVRQVVLPGDPIGLIIEEWADRWAVDFMRGMKA